MTTPYSSGDVLGTLTSTQLTMLKDSLDAELNRLTRVIQSVVNAEQGNIIAHHYEQKSAIADLLATAIETRISEEREQALRTEFLGTGN
jgi:maltooligosyltrehalose synthase